VQYRSDNDSPLLTCLPEDKRTRALERFQAIRPFLEEGMPVASLARDHGISVRTAWRWIGDYRSYGLPGLARKERADKDQRKLSPELRQIIEGLALGKPRLSVAAIHRRILEIAGQRGERPPGYSSVYAIIRDLEPALLTLAHDGTKAYSDQFDLIYRNEAEGPNAIWQADHTQLDMMVRNERGEPGRPWLTIILDDYSRAVAGYFLSFSAPSAIQTALAFRQAIWRKPHAGWHVCGIPQVLYTDHGSDFTSRHIEQVTADLKVRLIFSAIGRPRGRGKVERFFSSLAQIFLSRLPGYGPASGSALLTLPELSQALEQYLVGSYLVTPHRSTGQTPQIRWESGGFLPRMPESLEQLDLLLLTVPQTRRVHADGIRFQGLRYIDPVLAAYIGEEVLLRYDPRDMAEVRVFHQDRFLCRAVCQELAGETVSLREITGARNKRRRALRQTLADRQRAVDSLLQVKRWDACNRETNQPPPVPEPPPARLKRYLSD
jgi:putative transposase